MIAQLHRICNLFEYPTKDAELLNLGRCRSATCSL